jgi:hypothetical protein
MLFSVQNIYVYICMCERRRVDTCTSFGGGWSWSLRNFIQISYEELCKGVNCESRFTHRQTKSETNYMYK